MALAIRIHDPVLMLNDESIGRHVARKSLKYVRAIAARRYLNGTLTLRIG